MIKQEKKELRMGVIRIQSTRCTLGKASCYAIGAASRCSRCQHNQPKGKIS